MERKLNNKKIIRIASILVATICVVVGMGILITPKDKFPTDKYVTSDLIKNLDTLERDQMEELARKTLIVMSDKEVVDSDAIKIETSGIMNVLTYNTSQEAVDAYEKYSKDESVLLCEYDKTVNVQQNEGEEQSDEEVPTLQYFESVADIMMNDLVESSNEKIYDKIISNIGKEEASQIPTIVVIDTGYNGEADFKYNATNGSSDVEDVHGHGTSMVEIIESEMGDIEYKLAVVKIANENGYANTSYLVKAFEYIGTIDPTVVNMSFITTDKAQSDVLLSYINKFSANGVAIVCSAGNLNDDASKYIPSGFDASIVVGSCDEEGNKKDFSNYGSTVDINIVSDSTSEASAKVSSLYAITYATNTNIVDILNESKVIFEPSLQDVTYTKPEGCSEESDDELWWWWCGFYSVLDYYNDINKGNYNYAERLMRNPYSNVEYKKTVTMPYDVNVGMFAGSTHAFLPKGTKLYIGYNCYNKLRENIKKVNPSLKDGDIQTQYASGNLSSSYDACYDPCEPPFVILGGQWYVSCSPSSPYSIYCGKHGHYSTIGGKSGWFSLKDIGSVTATTYTINYYNGSTKIGSSSHTYDVAKNLKTWSHDLGGSVKNSSYGWVFEGWSTSSQSTSRTYTNGQSVKNLTKTNGGVINLYAVYKRSITFKHGVNAATTKTDTQYWNPYGTKSGTHLTAVSSPALAAIPNWIAGEAPSGYRQDTIATSLQYTTGSIYPDAGRSSTLYGVYFRKITFKSGVNASSTDISYKSMQYLNAYGNTVSSITSGMPTYIPNWSTLGYRDDKTAGDKEYAYASSIKPAYNTGNTFYATYSRPLTISYDKNSPEPFVATGFVASTTKTVYMNTSSTTTSSQQVTLSSTKFVRIGFSLTKWDIGNLGASYTPGLAYNHATFNVIAKAMWEHDGSGVGTFETPSLKVNNPNANGIYYNNGIYFVKGDGKTIVEIYGEATLNPELITRIDKISLNDGENMFTNTTYTETYNIEVPKGDVWNFVYNKSNVTNYNTHIGDFKAYENPTIVDITQNKLSFTQKFTITGRVLEEQYIGARASCVYEPCTHSDHTINVYGNSVRFHGDPDRPYAYIIDESGNKVSLNEWDEKWTNQKKVTIEFKDDDSGIKYYKLTKGPTIVEEVTNASNTLTESIMLNLEEGAFSYTLYVIDNVGNETTYNFTPQVDMTAPTLKDLVDYKVMGNENVPQDKNAVYTDGSTNTWPTTNEDVTWEYDWQKLKYLKFQATEDRSGFRKVIVHHYGQDSDYEEEWKAPSTLVNVSGDVLDVTKEQLIESFNDSHFYLEGKNYLLIELEDLAGNKTNVKLVVRRDSKAPSITNAKVDPVRLDNLTKSEIESIFASGDMSRFKTNISFSVTDNLGTDDTSGIQKLEIVIYNKATSQVLKKCDVTDQLAISGYILETSQGNVRFGELIRTISGTVNFKIDTINEFPGVNELLVEVEATDYTGNKSVKSAENINIPGGKVIPNYAIKTILYATKEEAYNVISSGGKSNMPYFKTGEVGFIEVWTIGYIDKLEIDFSDGSIGQEMNKAIADGQVSPKYILGVHGGLPGQVRYVTDMSSFKVNSNFEDYNGIPYAAHISYPFNEVNNSMGSTGIDVDGWKEKGTMIRIPQNHELVEKKEIDKYGNKLYKWETHIANVYPMKGAFSGTPSGSYYTIWDESGDDLHFRITHLTLGY